MPEPTKYSHIGQAIRALRKARGWKQQDLAALVGVQAPLISMVETGKPRYTNMQLDSIERYAAAFDLHAADLIAMVDTKVPA